MEIDFVLTWVDMTDPNWQAAFKGYSKNESASKNGRSIARFRDNGLLKYWFRGVEKFAPWVRKIHFVTCGHIPIWLDVSNPKLAIVNHSDIIPSEFLPTFNSVVIERYLHKIPALTEHFVYFNDDVFIINNAPEDRFFKNGLPCDIAVFDYNPSWSQWYRQIKNNVELINRYFDKNEVMTRWHNKWFDKCYERKMRWNYILRFYGRFITLRVPHSAQPYLKSTFDDVWTSVGEELTATSSNRFRARNDYTPELFRMWQICQGNFAPYNTYSDSKMFPLLTKSKQALNAIIQRSYKLICLNDNAHIHNYENVMERLMEAFEYILPNKSSFEI